jgi:hypothetical protein
MLVNGDTAYTVCDNASRGWILDVFNMSGDIGVYGRVLKDAVAGSVKCTIF